MEKFTDWRDKGTGIAPFLPVGSGRLGLGAKVGCTLLLVVKFLVVSPLILVYWLTRSKAVFRWVMSFLFDWSVDVTVLGIKRRNLKKHDAYPHRGRFYVCKSSSALDAYILDSIAQGKSTFLVASGNALYAMNKCQYSNYALDGSLNVKKYAQEIHNGEILQDRVVFMFPEGTCSNGKSVLPFEIDENSVESLLGENLSVQVTHLKINPSLTTPLRVSRWELVTRMVANGVHAKIKIHEAQNIAPLDKLRVALNDGNKFKLVSKTLDVEAKRKFVSEYERTQ